MFTFQDCARMTIATAAIAASTACSMTAPTLQETRELEVQVSRDARFSIDAGAGSLLVTGESGADTIRVSAEIYQVEANDDYTLTLETDSEGRVRLVADTGSGPLSSNDRIDLSIRVPESVELDIVDGSGSMQVSGLTRSLDIEDGSGSIRISEIGGDVTIDDGSGSLSVDNVGGSLGIEDGSGSIDVRETGGDVAIHDGSGSITVRNTGGKVTVDDDSGSINVDSAEDFELLGDGSGSVSASNIRSRDS